MKQNEVIIKLRAAIAEQIELTNQAKKANMLQVRPILEKKDKSLITALLAIHDALEIVLQGDE
jgi:hypothetical protein